MTTTSTNERIVSERMTGIGGSDAGAICGVNPYKTIYDVWLEKRGLVEPAEENEAMRWGLVLEAPIRREYERISGRKTVPSDVLWRHREHDYMIAHVDGLITNDDGTVNIGILEIKTAGEYTKKVWGLPGTDVVPESYLLQVQHYMAVLNLPFADIAALIGGRDFRIYHIERNDLIINYLIQREAEFWQMVQSGITPPVDNSEAARHFLAAVYPEERYEEIAPSPEMVAAVEQLFKFREAKKALDKSIVGVENEIKQFMGEAGLMQADGWKVTWKKNRDTTAVDWQQVAAEFKPQPELIAKYSTKKIGARVFKPRQEGEDNNNG